MADQGVEGEEDNLYPQVVVEEQEVQEEVEVVNQSRERRASYSR